MEASLTLSHKKLRFRKQKKTSNQTMIKNKNLRKVRQLDLWQRKTNKRMLTMELQTSASSILLLLWLLVITVNLNRSLRDFILTIKGKSRSKLRKNGTLYLLLSLEKLVMDCSQWLNESLKIRGNNKSLFNVNLMARVRHFKWKSKKAKKLKQEWIISKHIQKQMHQECLMSTKQS